MSNLLSCIVPVYRVEKYLHTCLDSILAQTFHDFELILVDDGSPDGCPTICDEYALRDSRIKVIHQQNKGLSGARNAGIDVASGKYLSFVDSDDFIAKDMFSSLLTLCEANDAMMGVCNYAYCFETKPNRPDALPETSEVEILTPTEAFRTAVTVYGRFSMAMWNKIYRRVLFDNVRFPEGKIYEDQAVQYRLLFQSPKIVYLHQTKYFYNINTTSITKQKYSPKEKDRYLMMRDMIAYIECNHPELLNEVRLYRDFFAYAIVVNKMVECHTCDRPVLKEIQQELKKDRS
ncbi:MAG: glycosyltransferase, partial [Lachnospiraceae bacterium]|nr:glycosyltransferase [Lachnospiraceae bacterium]